MAERPAEKIPVVLPQVGRSGKYGLGTVVGAVAVEVGQHGDAAASELVMRTCFSFRMPALSNMRVVTRVAPSGSVRVSCAMRRPSR